MGYVCSLLTAFCAIIGFRSRLLSWRLSCSGARWWRTRPSSVSITRSKPPSCRAHTVSASPAYRGVFQTVHLTNSSPFPAVVPNPAHASDADLPAKVAAYVAELVAPFKRLRGGVYLVDVVPKS